MGLDLPYLSHVRCTHDRQRIDFSFSLSLPLSLDLSLSTDSLSFPRSSSLSVSLTNVVYPLVVCTIRCPGDAVSKVSTSGLAEQQHSDNRREPSFAMEGSEAAAAVDQSASFGRQSAVQKLAGNGPAKTPGPRVLDERPLGIHRLGLDIHLASP